MISHPPFLINTKNIRRNGKDFFRKRIKQTNELREQIYPQLSYFDYLGFDFISEWDKIALKLLNSY